MLALAVCGLAHAVASRQLALPQHGASARIARAPRMLSVDEARRVLGVNAAASQSEIRRAFKRRAMETHPDRSGAPDAVVHFRAAVNLLFRSVPNNPRYNSARALPTREARASKHTRKHAQTQRHTRRGTRASIHRQKKRPRRKKLETQAAPAREQSHAQTATPTQLSHCRNLILGGRRRCIARHAGELPKVLWAAMGFFGEGEEVSICSERHSQRRVAIPSAK